MQKKFKNEYNFMPDKFLLPQDRDIVQEKMKEYINDDNSENNNEEPINYLNNDEEEDVRKDYNEYESIGIDEHNNENYIDENIKYIDNDDE